MPVSDKAEASLPVRVTNCRRGAELFLHSLFEKEGRIIL